MNTRAHHHHAGHHSHFHSHHAHGLADSGIQELEHRTLLSAPIVDWAEPVDPELATTATTTSTTSTTAPYALSSTFSLHSHPTANQTIFLDFNGNTTTGTSWNTAYAGGRSIVTPAYDSDGNPSSFSSTELATIQRIWQRVAEDFSPFNVDVTTQQPALSDLIKSSSTDTRWGVRAVIGGSSYDWYKASAGGVAYVGSFNWNTDTPCFIFSTQMGNGNEKYTAEGITHEVGHTLGLSHDGRTSPVEEYFAGQGNWASLMGVGYYKDLTQFNNGSYASANNRQDDLSIIASSNGFGYRPDEAGNTTTTAAPLSVSGSAVSARGVIQRSTDVDVFSFNTGAGAVSLKANPAPRGPDLNIKLDLLNSTGTVIASSNPTGTLSASISMTVPAGKYFARIDGVGEGDPLTTGYTDYGSIGQYSVTGTIVATSTTTSTTSATLAPTTTTTQSTTTSTTTTTTIQKTVAASDLPANPVRRAIAGAVPVFPPSSNPFASSTFGNRRDSNKDPLLA